MKSLSPTSFDEDAGWLTQYQVTYTFQPEPGQSFTRQQGLSQEFFVTLAQEDAISVTYLPVLPRFSRPVNTLANDDYAVLVLTTILTAYLLILGAGLAGQAIVQFIDERF